jgi:cation diffusion facilitator family transporter
MHTQSLDAWRHAHVFLGEHHHRHERRVWLVVALTAAMMVAEIVGGMVFGSVALAADGWHMATHAAALSISGLAYAFARRHAGNPRYTFGTGKFGELAGYTSAILLAIISLGIVYQAAERLRAPVEIRFTEAMLVAVVGLAVNLLSAWLLAGDSSQHDHHHHGHDHAHEHPAHHGDGNRRAAFAHVLADAVTSALAIVALLGASIFGWSWIDPAVGLLGAILIASWAVGLMRSTSAVLLDVLPSDAIASTVRKELETGDDRIADLHVWQLGPEHLGVIVSIVTHDPMPPDHYKARLRNIPHLAHVTVEVVRCA